ncbi:MAG TPA: hypothetical protein VN442_26045 [Bryobacteraceae bacterium]|nr:hypothetical protein [Bryobacteraceae bacterium]
MKISRRELSRLLCASLPTVVSGAARETATLRNNDLEFAITIDADKVVARNVANRRTRESVELPVEIFSLEFADGHRTSSAAFKTAVTKRSATALEFLFDSSSDGLQLRVAYELEPRKHYLRKRIFVRQTGDTPRRLLAVELENWRGVRRPWASMTADPMKCGSHPIYCDTWWAGVEFVAAFNEYSGDGFLLRSRPGGVRIGAEWVPLRPTVIGTAMPHGARESFLRYLDDVRLAPPRFVSCYNAWWTLPKVITEADSRRLIDELKAGLHARHGVFFDFVTLDMGWSNPRSIWEIDRSILPDGLAPLRQAVESAGGKLGLWMSPSEQYPPVCDYEWAEKNGYVVLRQPDAAAGRVRPAVSLADPRYRAETKAALSKVIREDGIAQIKYDGFEAREFRAHHDLLPGDDSVEPLAAYALELLQVSKEANPNLVTEPTFLNSLVCYISPWQLMNSDTLWGNTTDCPLGINPAPEYRESHTNAREWLIFRSMNEVWVPQNAVHYFDIVHVDAPGGFANHAAMAVGRGRFFLSSYINPKLMSDDDWRIYAGLIRWAKSNQDILRNTTVVPSQVQSGEPYVYAHWLGKRGILAVRNPSNETREYALDLAAAGAPATLADAVCYTQYPYRRGIAAGVSYGTPVRLRMAPWEVLFLEIVPRTELRETVVIGARWYRESADATSIVPDPDAMRVRVFSPGGGEKVLPVKASPAEPMTAVMRASSTRALPESDWLTHRPIGQPYFQFNYPAAPNSEEARKLKETAEAKSKPETLPTCTFEIDCDVTVPAEVHGGKVLLLVEFPGRKFRPVECTATVDGAAAPLETSNSSNHTGFYAASKTNAWKDMARHESQWWWFTCEVKPGKASVKFTGRAGDLQPRFRLWAWTSHDLTKRRIRIPFASSEPSMPQHQPEWLHSGSRVGSQG